MAMTVSAELLNPDGKRPINPLLLLYRLVIFHCIITSGTFLFSQNLLFVKKDDKKITSLLDFFQKHVILLT